jgi:hypothetical protein
MLFMVNGSMMKKNLRGIENRYQWLKLLKFGPMIRQHEEIIKGFIDADWGELNTFNQENISEIVMKLFKTCSPFAVVL